MKTDYQSLNWFDSSIVLAAVLGLGLIGAICFSQLPASQQVSISQSLTIFDISSQLAVEQQTTGSMIDSASNYLDKFYLAFTDVATIPAESLEVPPYLAEVYDDFAHYADQIASNYNFNNSLSSAPQLAYDGGLVLGAIIDLSSSVANNPNCWSLEVKIPYSYTAPDLNVLESSWSEFAQSFKIN